MTTVLNLHVVDKRLIAESIVLLELQASDGAELPAFTAGAHLQLELPGGLSRAYSLCNDPAERHRYQLAVHLDPASRGGSRAVHTSLAIGHSLQVGAPRNLFALDETAPHSVLVAGGIGITPMLAMARRLQSLGASWELHYANRTPTRCAFREELTTGPLAAGSRLYFDDAPAGERLEIARLLAGSPAGSHLYVCGPAGLIDLTLATAQSLGWNAGRLHSERFVAAPPASGERAFTLVLVRSGLTLEVPADRSVMSVVHAAGIDLPVSCEQGVCGTCITDVISGRPDHRDQCLDDALREQCFTPCCSRSLDAVLSIDL
jgi:vanillate O-demethylase ferredoxin subunit